MNSLPLPGPLAGRRALVTGASRGIGRATAARLAELGASVCVHYGSDKAAAEETLGLLAGNGHAAVPADLTDPAAVTKLMDAAVTALGGLDILVNNAGVFFSHRIDAVDYEEWQEAWRKTIALNLLGPANLMHAAVPHLKAAGGGRIVNVSSRGAFRGEPDSPAYGASKAGLNALTQSLAVSLGKDNIQCMLVAPGFVATDMTKHLLDGPEGSAIRMQSPMNRVASVDDVAATIAWLAQDEAEFLSGSIVDVNGASYLRS